VQGLEFKSQYFKNKHKKKMSVGGKKAKTHQSSFYIGINPVHDGRALRIESIPKKPNPLILLHHGFST
jgi:hypothetical protein